MLIGLVVLSYIIRFHNKMCILFIFSLRLSQYCRGYHPHNHNHHITITVISPFARYTSSLPISLFRSFSLFLFYQLFSPFLSSSSIGFSFACSRPLSSSFTPAVLFITFYGRHSFRISSLCLKSVNCGSRGSWLGGEGEGGSERRM